MGARFNVRLSEELQGEIKRLAHEAGMTPHDFIRRNWARDTGLSSQEKVMLIGNEKKVNARKLKSPLK